MVYLGMFGVWLAGSSTQKFIQSDDEWKYLALAAFEGVTGMVIVMTNI